MPAANGTTHACAERITPRDDAGARLGARGAGVEMRERHAALCQFCDVGGVRNRGRAVGVEAR